MRATRRATLAGALAAGTGLASTAKALGGRGAGAESLAAPDPGMSAEADQPLTLTSGTNFCAALASDNARLALDLYGMIWLLPISGGAPRALTPPLMEASQPAWIPGTDLLVFQAFTDGYFQLWTVDSSSGALTQITHAAHDHREPAPAPDGLHIAYISDAKGRCQLAILNRANGAFAPWGLLAGEAAQPAWSPDGAEIVCIIDDIRLMRAGRKGVGAELAAIPKAPTPLDRSRLAGPAFTPDGKDIAYVEVSGDRARLRLAGGADLVSGEDVFPFRPQWLAGGGFLYTANGGVYMRRSGESVSAPIPFALTLPFPGRAERPWAAARAHSDARRAHPRGKPALRGIVGPAPAPDGQAVAFVALNALWIARRGGAAQKLVDNGFAIADPAWSPDGRRLAFVTDAGGTLDIWLYDIAAATARQLTHHKGAAGGPAWSPDGTQIAFYDQSGALFIAGAESGAITELHGRLFDPGRPSWSPDGKTIALAALRPASGRFREGLNQILLVNTEDKTTRFVTIPEGRSLASRGDDGPAWSPDGRYMALIIAAQLWLLPVDARGMPAGALRRLTSEISDCPRWDGDGRSLTYLSGTRLRRLDIASATARNVPLRLHPAAPRRERPLIIRAGKLWDGEGQSARERVDIVIKDQRIAALRPAEGALGGEGAQWIDARSRCVMPGLVDCHAHLRMRGQGLGSREGRLWLAMGVTTIRSLAGPAYKSVEYQEAVAAGRLWGPRAIITGEALDGRRIYYPMMRPVADSAQLARELNRAQALGYQVMKCYVRLGAELQKQVVRWSHRRGLAVTSHYLYPAMLLGMDGMEHMGASNKLGYSRSVSLTGRVYPETEAILIRTGAAQSPTLFQSTALYRDYPELLDDPRLRSLLPPWQYRRLQYVLKTGESPLGAARERILAHNIEHLRALIRGGGVVVAGSDAPLDILGLSLHMNLRAMVKYGMTPHEALRSATSTAGRVLAEPLGIVRPGAYADLLIVKGDPLARIEDAANIETIITQGRRTTPGQLAAPFSRA